MFRFPLLQKLFWPYFKEIDLKVWDVETELAPDGFDEHQAKAWASPFKKNLVMAGAGAGKTRVVVERAKLLVDRGVSPQKLLFITYSNDATDELKRRLKKNFGNVLNSVNFPKVMTIHEFSRRCFSKINKDLKQTYEERPTSPIYETWKKLLNGMIKKDPSLKGKLFEWRKTKKILQAGLNIDYIYKNLGGGHEAPSLETISGVRVRSRPEQLIADFLFEKGIPFEYEKPVLFCDWPFRPDFYLSKSGCYVEYLGLWNAENPEVREGYRKAYESKKEQFQKHKWPEWMTLEIYPKDMENDKYKEIISEKVTYLDSLKNRRLHIAKQLDTENYIKKQFEKPQNIYVDFLINLADCIEVNMADEAVLRLKVPFLFIPLLDLIDEISKAAKHSLKDMGFITANDMFKELGERLDRDSGLVKDIKAEYDYMFLDEFQDVTPLTFQFLCPLLKEIPFFAIGDDRQAIYGFAGGTPYFIQNLKDKVPGTARKNLIYNYRSNQTIVQTSAIFADPKAVKSVAKDPSEGKIFLIVVENEKAQVKQVAEEIRNRIKETPLMVISRNRPETNPVVKAYLDEMGKQAQFMTVHKSKGLEKEAVLIVNVIEDAEEQYTVPARDKDHPVVRYIKANGFQDAILAEEERLFYVALSRAEKYLFIVTEEKRESVFIKKIKENQKNHEVIFLKSPLSLTKAGKE